MADGSRYTQQAGDLFYQQYTPRTSLPTEAQVHIQAHVNSLLYQFATGLLSPSRSPDSNSQLPPSRAMFNVGQHRSNGNPPGRTIGGPYGYGQPNSHQHQGHSQHHPSMQPDHGSHSGTPSTLGHPSNYSAGMLPNGSPYSGSLQNGHGGGTNTRTGPTQPVNEHWAEQLRLHKESESANLAMVDQKQANYYARLKANENRGIGAPAPSPSSSLAIDGETEERRRPWSIQESNKRQDWHNLDLSGQGLRALAPALFAYEFLQELYIASNKLSALPSAIGELRHLRLLEASHNQITELPPELGMCTFLKQLLLFNNHIRNLPCELGSLYLLDVLGIEGNPLNPELKSKIVEHGTKNIITFLREQAPVPLPPIPRRLVTLVEDVSPSLERVKVFSWNIFCDRYAYSTTYGYTPSAALSWDYRKDLILQELLSRDADILCLQEINRDSLDDLFGPELAKEGYRHLFSPKSRHRLMHGRDSALVDGCAIFYKSDKYVCLDHHTIECNNLGIYKADLKAQHDIFNRVAPKDNVAAVALLQSRQTGERIIVVNAHLAWEASLADVKIVQTAIILECVTKLANSYLANGSFDREKKRGNRPILDSDGLIEPAPARAYHKLQELPMLVCGDYNSTAKSGVYELLEKGYLAPNHPEIAKYQYGDFTRSGIKHDFTLRSAYLPLNGTADELPFTNYTPGFNGVIDYIWYTTGTFEVIELLGPPDAQYLKRVPGFPNYHFPADHIQIMAELVIKARKDTKKAGAQ